MKQIILSLALSLVSFALSGQTFTEKTHTGSGFDVGSGKATGSNFSLEGKTFPLFQTQTGSLYVKAISSTGSTYAVWIGTDTGKEFEGKKVYQSKKGSYCYYSLSKTGYPVPRWLDSK